MANLLSYFIPPDPSESQDAMQTLSDPYGAYPSLPLKVLYSNWNIKITTDPQI